MKTRLRALSLMVVVGALIGCAAAPRSQPDAGSGAGPSGNTAAPFDPGSEPKIDWDHPFHGEGRTNVDAVALAASPQSFGTPIHPVTPQLSPGTLRWVDVSAAGTVAYMFDFAGDAAFPTDGRVSVEESLADMTQDELINGKWAGTTNSRTAVGVITILVRSFQGRAEASFIHDGTLYDFVGADLGPEPALNIATQLAKQLN
jgi:hypothetical protein